MNLVCYAFFEHCVLFSLSLISVSIHLKGEECHRLIICNDWSLNSVTSLIFHFLHFLYISTVVIAVLFSLSPLSSLS